MLGFEVEGSRVSKLRGLAVFAFWGVVGRGGGAVRCSRSDNLVEACGLESDEVKSRQSDREGQSNHKRALTVNTLTTSAPRPSPYLL